MNNKERILDIIYLAIDDVNAQIDKLKKIKKSENTILIGANSELDSLALINFILNIERTFNEEFSLDITLTDQQLLLEPDGPFNKINTLVDYLDKIIKG